VEATQASIQLTQAAARRIWELLSQEGNYNLKLRIYITGGGCSGFQYGFAFDEALQPDDCVVSTQVEGENGEESHGGENSGGANVSTVVDPLSLMYLNGATVDYVESLQGAHFTVKNPNAQTTCSCGSSFAL
jgi:iron-sulfur cluster insertion protein